MRGFGSTTVYGRKRVPLPPANTTARLDIVEVTLVACEIRGGPEPVCGDSKSLLEAHARTKSSGGGELSIVAAQPLDLAAPRPRALCFVDRHRIDAHDATNHHQEIPDRDLAVRADVE